MTVIFWKVFLDVIIDVLLDVFDLVKTISKISSRIQKPDNPGSLLTIFANNVHMHITYYVYAEYFRKVWWEGAKFLSCVDIP